MSERHLRAVEILERPPLTDIPKRLRTLADELPEGTRAVIVLTIPGCDTYGFGEALTHAEAIGYLTYAATQFRPES